MKHAGDLSEQFLFVFFVLSLTQTAQALVAAAERSSAVIRRIDSTISIVAAAVIVRLMLSLMPANICRGSVR